jgi:hypothetical protein
MSELSLRPAVQRTEIGPIFATIVPEVVKIARGIQSELFEVATILDSHRYAGNGEIQTESFLAAVASDLTATVRNANHEWYNTHSDDARIGAINRCLIKDGVKFTHYKQFEDVLDEGMKSGVIMPLKVFHMIDELTKDNHGAVGERVVKSLREPWIDEMLHKLARGPNGSLGSWSTDVVFDRLKHSRGEVLKQFVITNDDGTFDLSDDYDAMVSEQLAEARANDRADLVKVQPKYSGGCPVRHAQYKSIGVLASAAFAEEDIDPAQLVDPSHVSPISLCREFVADRVEEMLHS